MNIRKLIREQIESILNEENPLSGPAIKGFEILNHFPFSKLPEARANVNWSNRGVSGWGEVHVPAFDGNGMSTFFAKDDVMEYMEGFKNKFGEEPLFIINPTAEWYGKIRVINEPYQKAKALYDKAVQSFGTEGD